MASTKYAVLSRQGADENPSQTLWKLEKMVDASSSKAAVAAFVKAGTIEKGAFVAVPVRSWTPITVSAERKVQLKFS